MSIDRHRTTMVARRKPLQTRSELHQWIREHLTLDVDAEQALLSAVDDVLSNYEQLWRDSKEEALRGMAHGVAQRVNRMQDELSLRDATSSNIVRYFEQLVDDLTQQTHRDPKTQLLNFRRFMENVELVLSMERRFPWCAIGVADIRSFKSHNDGLGHAAGDRIIERVATLVSREIRASDLVAHQHRQANMTPPLHARFGGDEFCFFLTDLADDRVAATIAERFRQAVAAHDWSIEDSRLTKGSVNVDIGVACLRLGPVAERQGKARTIAQELFSRADQRLYEVKRDRPLFISCEWLRIDDGRLVEVDAKRRSRRPSAPTPTNPTVSRRDDARRDHARSAKEPS
jgi:diguanylate cyclase (GGDEF)-like protein